MSSPDVIVIGAGVLGLCTAAELAGRGYAVTVVDSGGPNASSVAAGMLAPALECLSDAATPERASLLLRARDLWPAFAERFDLPLHRDGVEWRGPDPEAALSRLAAFGVQARRTERGLFTPDDWRVEVAAAMTALARAPGVARLTGGVIRVDRDGGRWRIETDRGGLLSAPAVVLATGAAAPLAGLPASVASLVAAVEPWRGQLTPLRGQSPALTLRAPGLYLVPTPGGALVGATMERGRRDLTPDPEVSRRQVEAGRALAGVVGEPEPPRVGVRGGTADGLPLAGATGAPGLHLALAPLRNGWLLGPLVAAAVADGIEGRPPRVDAAALDPLRFG